jgi:hypothetical protein
MKTKLVLGKSVNDKVWVSVYSVWSSVNISVDDLVYDSVSSSVYYSVWSSVNISISNRL